MDMNTMTLPRKGLKTSQYKELMDKKTLKKLSKSLLKRDSINKPISPRITGKWESVKPKPVPRKTVNEDIILQPPKGFRDRPPKPKDDFNFDDHTFQTENTSLGTFKIISIQSRENEKFKGYTNEFKVKIL